MQEQNGKYIFGVVKVGELNDVIGNGDRLAIFKPISGNSILSTPKVLEQYNSCMNGHTENNPVQSLDYSRALYNQINEVIKQTAVASYQPGDEYWYFW